MERSESEAVLESLNLNPQILVNEILNTVENLLDEAFDFFHQEASILLNAEGIDRSEHLSQESLGESLPSQDMLCELDLDAQLDSLRESLTLIGKESAELNHELQVLEKQSTLNDYYAAIVNEALQLYKQNSADEMLQEMVSAASELRTKMVELRTKRIEDIDCIRTKKFCDSNRDLSSLNHGISGAKLEDLQEFLTDLKKM